MSAQSLSRVLITGGSGLIGSNICSKLLEMNYQPVVFDAFIQYISPFESSYQKHLTYRFRDTREKIIFERGDTRDKGDIRRIILKYCPEVIIHLAALPIADLSYTHSEETIESIINGTVNILEVIRELNFVKRFVYASSSMVYGDFKKIPAPEDHPKAPMDIYGGTKLAGEILTEAYSRRFGIEHTIIRPSAVYGPTDINRRVIQIFIENAMQGKKLIIRGDDSNLIDFTYVEDCANGFVLAAFSKNAANQAFNITRGQGRNLIELADCLKTYFPGLEVEYQPMDKNRPLRGALSIEKARDLLNYHPKYSLEDGISKYYEFYKNI